MYIYLFIHSFVWSSQFEAKSNQIKILSYSGIAQSGFEQPGPEASLLGLAKSFYFFFRLNTPKATAVEPLEDEQTKRFQNHIFNP